MAKKLKVAFGVAAAVAMLGLALAVPTNAQSNLVTGVDASEQGTIYVAAGILGDVQIGPCLGTLGAIDGVTVSAGVTGAGGDPSVATSVPLGTQTPAQDFNICAGGDVQAYTIDSASRWTVSINDWVYNGLGTTTPGADSVSAPVPLPAVGLARLQATYTWRVNPDAQAQAASGDATCVFGAPSDTDVCLAKYGGSDTSFRNTNVWGVCGSGEVAIDNSKLNHTTRPSPYNSNPTGDFGVTAQVFVDGAVFFQLDCPMVASLASTASAQYNDVTQTGDAGGAVPSPLDAGCPAGAGECVAVNDYTCNDSNNPVTGGVGPDPVCLFPLPVSPTTTCLPANFLVSVAGIVGTVRQSFDSASVTCGASTTHDANWGNFDSEDSLETNPWIFLPDAPVSVDASVDTTP